MNKKILIFGKGYIGSKLQKHLNCSATGKAIREYKDIQTEINRYQPKIIINCIGYTGKNNVDDCEKDIDGTMLSNTFVPILMAEAAVRNSIKLIHVSSGCIYNYDYKKQLPIKEKLVPDFFELLYSRTKIYADDVISHLSGVHDVLIVRIRIPLDNVSNPKNVINKLLKYKTVIDVPNSVTYVPDLLLALEHLIKINANGIYNVVAKGGLRYPDLMDEYRKYNPRVKYSTISLKDLKVKRTNLILSTRKLEKSGFKVRGIKEIIKECVKQYVEG